MGLIPQADRGLLEYPLEGPWRPEAWGRFLVDPLVPDGEGRLRLSDRPGLGAEIDWSVIGKFGRRVYDGNAVNTALSALRDRGLHAARALKSKKAEQVARSAAASFSLPVPPF
ncbi:MAG: hypothetical protein JRH11_00295 [Deltaproteobacteria bacterium]|nr:hypothetical protein [Deltaproteobacteria bacterium]